MKRPSHRGEDNPNSRLTKQDVSRLRAQFVAGKYTVTQLAERYKISKGMVSMILHYQRWRET